MHKLFILRFFECLKINCDYFYLSSDSIFDSSVER